MFCKNCGNLAPLDSSYCNKCGSPLHNSDITKFIERYETEVENTNIKKDIINTMRMDIRDMPKVDDNRYSSARLKTGTRREFNVYKLIEHVKYDNDGLATLVDNWIYNPTTPVSKIMKFDRYNRLDCEV